MKMFGIIIGTVFLLATSVFAAQQPNILLVVIDTLRYDALHCDGNDAVQTPTIDALAAAGTRFAHAYVNASWTRPSVASILSGDFPHRHGVIDRGGRLTATTHTIPGELRRNAGYRTAIISANPNISTNFGFGFPFDEFLSFGMVTMHIPTTPANVVIDRAVKLIPSLTSPWFLFVFLVDPHEPYTPPAPYDTMYDQPYPGAPNGQLVGNKFITDPADIPNARDLRHYRALYDGEVAFTDHELARLLTVIDSTSTLVVLTSDHGQGLWQHMQPFHGYTLYDSLIHVPLILRGPGIRVRRVVSVRVQSVDLYPTLLHFVGVPVEPGKSGRDLLHLAGPTPPILAEEKLDGFDLASVIVGDQKLILNRKTKATERYDLRADPGERHPVPAAAPTALLDTLAQLTGQAVPPSATQPACDEHTEAQLKALGYGGCR
jgi:arylsulfatase A-like enzyme